MDNLWHLLKQEPGIFLHPSSNMESDNLPVSCVHHQPEPLLMGLAAYKAPHFIGFTAVDFTEYAFFSYSPAGKGSASSLRALSCLRQGSNAAISSHGNAGSGGAAFFLKPQCDKHTHRTYLPRGLPWPLWSVYRHLDHRTGQHKAHLYSLIVTPGLPPPPVQYLPGKSSPTVVYQ